MDVESHLPLAPRDLLILAVLAEGPLHGYGIIKAVEARSRAGVLLDPANLYRVLRRMRRLGWIREASRSVGAEPMARGRRPEGQDPSHSVSAETSGSPANNEGRRKTYRVTPHGRAILAAELARLQRLLEHARPALVDGEGA